MANVTLAIDEELLGKARSLAETRRTSLNALIRSLLAHEVEQQDRVAWARAGLKRLMEESTLEIDPDINVKELGRRYVAHDTDKLHGHQHPGVRGREQAE